MDGAKAGADDLGVAMARVDAGSLDDACLGFDRAWPQRSARRRLHVTQALWLIAIAALVAAALSSEPAVTLAALHIIALVFFAAAILVRLLAAAQLTPVLSRLAAPRRWPTYTILCPLYREANVARDLVGALAQIDYPGIR